MRPWFFDNSDLFCNSTTDSPAVEQTLPPANPDCIITNDDSRERERSIAQNKAVLKKNPEAQHPAGKPRKYRRAVPDNILRDANGEPITICAVADPGCDPKPQARHRRRQSKLPPKTRPRKNTKLTGELGEAAFLHKAIHLGLCVARPWGDSRRYDFLIQSSPTSNVFYRIQVKCTESINARGYQVQSTYCDGKRKGKYTSADIDFLVGYIINKDLFYIVPIADCPKSASLRFYPDGSERNQAKLEHFREAWRLLGAKRKSGDDHESPASAQPRNV